jgi:hypothetical protein
MSNSKSSNRVTNQVDTCDTKDQVVIEEADRELINNHVVEGRVLSRKSLNGVPDYLSASNGSLSERRMVRAARKRSGFNTATSSIEFFKSAKK